MVAPLPNRPETAATRQDGGERLLQGRHPAQPCIGTARAPNHDHCRNTDASTLTADDYRDEAQRPDDEQDVASSDHRPSQGHQAVRRTG